MNKLAVYYKAIAGAVLAGLGAATTALLDGHISNVEWIGIAIAVIGTSGAVGIVTNAPNPKAQTAAEKSAADLAARVGNVEDQLPTISDIGSAVSSGIVTGLQTLGHVGDTAPVRAELTAAAAPDVPDADATPAQILASVPVDLPPAQNVTVGAANP